MNCIDFVCGKSKVFGIVGNPIEHTFSPILQNTIAKAVGIDMVYVPFCVELSDLEAAINGAKSLGITGLNVTVPYKTEAMKNLCDIDEKALHIGAVNTLKLTPMGYKGYNTDVIGLEKCFETRNICLKDKTVIVAGAGGAANAAAVVAAELGAKKLFIANRTRKKADDLGNRIRSFYDLPVVVCGYDELMNIENPDIFIQTTSVGMGSTWDKTPIATPGFFEKVTAVMDVIYSPWETRLLKEARERGCITINGFDMLIYQGMASFEIWNDIKIQCAMAEKIKDALAAYYCGNKEHENGI